MTPGSTTLIPERTSLSDPGLPHGLPLVESPLLAGGLFGTVCPLFCSTLLQLPDGVTDLLVVRFSTCDHFLLACCPEEDEPLLDVELV